MYVWKQYAYVLRPKRAWMLGAGASVMLSAGVWSTGMLVSPFAQASYQGPEPLYPEMQQEVEVIDVSAFSVAEILATVPELSRFDLLLYNARARDQLNGGFYTVFAPAGNYFDYLPQGTVPGMSVTEKRELALSHIVNGYALAVRKEDSGTYETLSGAPVEFLVDEEARTATAGGAYVLRAYRAHNGIIYVINRVLYEPDAP